MNKKRIISVLLACGIISQVIYAPGAKAQQLVLVHQQIQGLNQEDNKIKAEPVENFKNLKGLPLASKDDVKQIIIDKVIKTHERQGYRMDDFADHVKVIKKNGELAYLRGQDLKIEDVDKINLGSGNEYDIKISVVDHPEIKDEGKFIIEGGHFGTEWKAPEISINFPEEAFYDVKDNNINPNFTIIDDLGKDITNEAKTSNLEGISVDKKQLILFDILVNDRMHMNGVVSSPEGRNTRGIIYRKSADITNEAFKKEVDEEFPAWKEIPSELELEKDTEFSTKKTVEDIFGRKFGKGEKEINTTNYRINIGNFSNVDTRNPGYYNVSWTLDSLSDDKPQIVFCTRVHVKDSNNAQKIKLRNLKMVKHKDCRLEIKDFLVGIEGDEEQDIDKLIQKYEITATGLGINTEIEKNNPYEIKIKVKFPKDHGKKEEVTKSAYLMICDQSKEIGNIDDTPRITAKEKIQVNLGSQVDTNSFTAKAVDYKNRDISNDIKFDLSKVNTAVKGTYKVTISVSDKDENKSAIEREVEVVQPVAGVQVVPVKVQPEGEVKPQEHNPQGEQENKVNKPAVAGGGGGGGAVAPAPVVKPVIPAVEEKKQEEAKSVARMGGKDRYDTSIKIADKFKAKVGKIEGIVIASGENFPDALSGAVLCKQQKAPMLLVNNQSKTKVLDYIKNNLQKGQTVNILGGTGVVNEDIKKEIEKAGYKVERLQGKDRYETNNKIVAKMGKSQVVFLATGNNYADAMSASAVAGKMNAPIVLCKDKLDDQVLKTINSTGAKKIVILGGTGAVSTDVEKILKTKGLNVERVSGKDRYETNQNILTKFGLDKLDSMAVADGNNYADALTGAGYSSLVGQGIKLINTKGKNTKLPTSVKNVDVFGGEGVISNKLVDSLK